MPYLLFCEDSHSVNLPNLCQDTHLSMKKNSKSFVVKKVGGWGDCNNPPRLEREGVAAKINKLY